MTLQPLSIKVIPMYRWRRDAHWSSRTRYVWQRTVKFVVTAVATGERNLAENITTLLNGIRIRQPLSDFMNGLNIFDLTGQPNTVYSRTGNVEGSDYESVPSSIYDWKIADAYHEFNEQDKVTRTVYVLVGQWDKWQGVTHSVVRRPT